MWRTATTLGLLLLCLNISFAVDDLPSVTSRNLPSFRISNSREFLQLVRTDIVRPTNGENPIVARSYDRNDWEAVPDADFDPVTISCSSNSCTIEDPGTYRMDIVPLTRQLTHASRESKWSRLLMQASFGFTKAELNATVYEYWNDYRGWVWDQMDLPATSHRSWFRQRTNARRKTNSEFATLYKACEIGSRYHHNALTPADVGQTLEIRNDEIDDCFSLYVAGLVRTDIAQFNGTNGNTATGPATTWTICEVEDRVGGAVYLDDGSHSCNEDYRPLWTVAINPEIDFTTNSRVTNKNLTPTSAILTPVDGVPDAVILTELTTSCDLPSVDSFIRRQNKYYRFDPRIKLLRNTLEEPVAVSDDADQSCPSVVKTFLNEATCRHESSCAPLEFDSAPVLLDEDNLRAWYMDDNIYVYEIRNLPLDEVDSPCLGTSRWERSPGACSAPTSLDAPTATAFYNALAASNDANPFVCDITIPAGVACSASSETIGASVTVGNECFVNVHPDLHTVYDMSYWVLYHPGNTPAEVGGRPNPIARWAEEGHTYLEFPSWHDAARWDDNKNLFTMIGRLGDEVPFSGLETSLQTTAMADRVGALPSESEEGFQACGSPHEIDNDPTLGDRYHFVDRKLNFNGDDFVENDSDPKRYAPQRLQPKATLWFDLAFNAPDQLRQRAAWALAQLIPVADSAACNYCIESWTNFYDIFVRNAFGNYRDILREISYNNLMTRWLSSRRNKSFAAGGAFPDENFAREVMQLFSIGLYKLNMDGTHQRDAQGNSIPAYSNDNILDYARVWTGFDEQPLRGNIELLSHGGGIANGIDPSQIKPEWHDYLPKAKLDHGYIGDGYPLCDRLPAHHWLLPGARYIYTGMTSREGPTMDAQEPSKAGMVGRFVAPPSSELHATLCAPDPYTGECTFPLDITLDSELSCASNSLECQLQAITTVAVYDDVADLTRYYTYQSVPCVKMAFFAHGSLTVYDDNFQQCAPRDQAVAMPACCSLTDATDLVKNLSPSICLATNEFMDADTAASRCQAMNLQQCAVGIPSIRNYKDTCAPRQFLWLSTPCTLQVQVSDTGRVNYVDPVASQLSGADAELSILREDTQSVFGVQWANGEWPQPSINNCGSGCHVTTSPDGQTCVCDITVTEQALYNTIAELPSLEDLHARLSQGALNRRYETGSYGRCREACDHLQGYRVWTTTTDTLGPDTIFEVDSLLPGGERRFFFNRESIVQVGSGQNRPWFRNPPRFMPGPGDIKKYNEDLISARDLIPQVAQEIDALIDHLFVHQNVAPFLAHRLIQRLVTSNPSPRYVQTVAEAFRTGRSDGRQYSGRYGDMKAAFLSIMLDPEARTPLLEADPTFGLMREPLIKVTQICKGLEMTSVDGRELTLSQNMVNKIGMAPYAFPSVFGFYLADNRPSGLTDELGIYAPEAELSIAPYIFGMMNEVLKMIETGLRPTALGAGPGTLPKDVGYAFANFQPANPNDAESVIDELDLLFTANRLNEDYRDHMIARYQEMLTTMGPEAALTLVEQLVLLSAEFHVSSASLKTSVPRQPPADTPSQMRPYKALVVVIADGGLDSYSALVPHSGCVNNLDQQYQTVRGQAAIPKGDLLQINVPSGTQPCTKFGLNPALTALKDLYNDGEAILLANTGALIEPVTKAEYYAKPLGVQLPPSLFAHNIMQRNTQSMHPQNQAAAGVLGRTVTALQDQPNGFRSKLYSMAGSLKITEGADPVYISSGGLIRFTHSNLTEDLNNVTSTLSQSAMTETYLSTLAESLRSSEALGDPMADVKLNTKFPGGSLGNQLQQVARVMHIRGQTQSERDVFVIRTGGFDSHDTVKVNKLMEPLDDVQAAFKAEAQSLGIWDDVAMLTISEFGRTLTTNGAGTDHAWGGNYFLVGGKVKGGKMLGEYPDTLTEGGPLDVGRGRLIPTTGWDAVWNGLLDWMDLDSSRFDEVLPNLQNFPSSALFTKNDLFHP